MNTFFQRFGYRTIVVVLLLMIFMPATAQESERISRPGEYQGYSEPIYKYGGRRSVYVTMRDGTRLAVDIYRPKLDGVTVEEPLPVIWTHDRYNRSGWTLEDMLEIVRYGYIVADVDARGTGASFGHRRGPFSPEETQDAYDITEWFAAQPWCDGNVGMYGGSYLGITQYMAASTQPPHLKAIFPEMAMFDLYSFIYQEGIFLDDFVLNWWNYTRDMDQNPYAAPVDADTDGILRQQAVAEHAENWNVYTTGREMPYRDSLAPVDGMAMYALSSPSSYVDAINESGVAVYTLAGWYDLYPRDAALWFNNLTVPQKVVFTPWSHQGYAGFNTMMEQLRWFDYWLKGIDNGIMDEPPIYYHVMGADEWRFADQWPLPEEQPTTFYFAAGPAESVDSVNDGLLIMDAPVEEEGQDVYPVDYTTTTGKSTRWTNGYGGAFGYFDMTRRDEKALTYTTPPLVEDMEITGHPIVHLWASVDAEDADFMVYLEEVDAYGFSWYVSEGVLKASHRALSTAPWNSFGLPYHSGLTAEVSPLVPGEIVELVFDLLPTSNVFDGGHRIRLSITGADADTFSIPDTDPPTLTLYRNTAHASFVVLPVIPAE